jgi:MFS family permease
MNVTLTRAPAQASQVQMRIVLLMFGLSVISYSDRIIMSIAGPHIVEEFALSEVQMGTVYSAFLCGYTLLMIPGGVLADHHGPRRVLTAMALGSALCTALTPLGGVPGLGAHVGIIPSFVLIRFGFGLTTAPLYPACGKMNTSWMPPSQRARVQGLVNAGAGVGGAIAPVLFGWMIADYGWRPSFFIAGIVTALLGLTWFFSVADRLGDPQLEEPLNSTHSQRRGTHQLAEPTPWRSLLTDRNVILLTLGYLGIGYFQYIFFYWIYYYLGKIRGLSPSQSAVYTTSMFLTFGLAMPIGGWLTDLIMSRYGRRLGLRLVGVGSLVLSAILLYLGANATSSISVMILMSLALGCAGVSDVTFWAGMMHIVTKEAGAACGILNFGGNVGGFVAPILTPYIASYLGWSWGLYFGSIIALAASLTWLWTDPRRLFAETATASLP